MRMLARKPSNMEEEINLNLLKVLRDFFSPKMVPGDLM